MDRSAKVIVAIVVIAASVFFIYSKFAAWHVDRLETTVEKEKKFWQDKTEQLTQEITTLRQELADFKTHKAAPGEPAEESEEVRQEDMETAPQIEEAAPGAEKQPGYAEVESQIVSFFKYMDDQEYVQSYKFEEGTFRQYQLAVGKLSSKLPITTGEMSSLYNVVRNVAHFYRVLGKNSVLLIKQFLQNESEGIESVMRTFYLWFTMDDKGQSTLKGRPSMESMYEYAGFILNTLGGRSYLLRRDPQVRALTSYYCVLILDKANDEELNSKGIDIRPYIMSSLMDIGNQAGLIHQKEYLAKLSELRNKYHPN